MHYLLNSPEVYILGPKLAPRIPARGSARTAGLKTPLLRYELLSREYFPSFLVY